jgi:hypothetical protein
MDYLAYFFGLIGKIRRGVSSFPTCSASVLREFRQADKVLTLSNTPADHFRSDRGPGGITPCR